MSQKALPQMPEAPYLHHLLPLARFQRHHITDLCLPGHSKLDFVFPDPPTVLSFHRPSLSGSLLGTACSVSVPWHSAHQPAAVLRRAGNRGPCGLVVISSLPPKQ